MNKETKQVVMFVVGCGLTVVGVVMLVQIIDIAADVIRLSLGVQP